VRSLRSKELGFRSAELARAKARAPRPKGTPSALYLTIADAIRPIG
jgi:hypothetical protein